MHAMRQRQRYWLGLVVSVVATLYCYSGVVTNSDFSITVPAARSTGHVLAAKAFFALTLAGLAVTVLLIIMLWRTRPSRPAI